MDLEFSPSILDTPSLNTPNMNTNPMIFKSSYTTTAMNVNNNSSSNPSSTTTNNKLLSVSTAEIKLSKIEHDLKQGFTQPRKPTESPFQKMVEAGVLTIDKNISMPSSTDDGLPADVPSTAEVMNVLESFSKNLNRDNVERETTTTLTSDINRLDTSPTHQMGVIVSPKKKLLIRSQSHTEPTSSSPNQYSQTQNDESPIDDHHFQQLHDLPILPHTIDSNTQLDNNIKPTYSIQLRTNQPLIKQQTMIVNNKRPFQQTVIGASIPKANSILIPQHEVTSSGQLLGAKRQKMTPMPTNNISIRSSTNDNHSDDQRKKLIRESNREAARRCRERRRQYIEQLEGDLERCKSQMKLLNEKLSRAERENTQLRAILTETKIFHPSSRLSSNESIVDFANVISTTNGMDLNSETINGNTISRSFINRNTH